MVPTDRDSLPEGSRESSLTRLLETGRDLICVVEASGRLLEVSAAWERLLGYTPDELVGRCLSDFIHPDDLAQAREVAAAVARPGTEVIEFENRYRSKDGQYRWLSWSARSDGTTWLALGRDITERREAEERAQLFISLVELSDDFIALAGLDERVLFVNAAGRRLVGLDSLEAALAHPSGDYLTEEGRHASRTVERPAVLEHGRWSGHGTLRHFKTGEPIEVSINSFLVTSPATGQPLALATVQHDITEANRVRAEVDQLARERARLAVLALREADNERARLAESLHDSVMQNLAIARQEIEELIAGNASAGPRAISAIVDSTAELRTTLRGIHPTAMAYEDLCMAIERLRGPVVEAGLAFRVSCADDIPIDMNGLIYGVVRELVRNAVEHARGSRVTVEVDHDGEIVTAAVSDDGVGIASGRLAAALREGHIGLAASRERALDADGKLLIQAVQPSGTRVVLVLPCPGDAV
jgi:PAS domain S-box-containing protein